GYTVAAFMAIGAMFGALNCMYSAIASRQVEIATLRAIGFSGTPVVISVMIEALLLALLGGAVGGALAYRYCDGTSLSTLNFNTFSQVAFDFRVTPRLLAQGLVWAWVFRSVLSASINAAFRLRPYESPYNSSCWQWTLDQWCFKLNTISSIVTCPLKS